MDLNRLLFNHQISLMARSGQLTKKRTTVCRVSHYARLIEDFHHREVIEAGLQRLEGQE